MRARFLVSLSCLSLSTFASQASAHVDLTSPTPRSLGSANGQNLKTAPCGQATNMRTATVATFTPGQMVEIKIEEYIDHSGYYAVSFDDDGDDDFPYPRANSDAVDPATDDPMTAMPIGDQVLGYHFDADMNCYMQPNRECTITVKMPNVNCDNCTLQVVQFMYDKTGNQNPDEHYYQCADIKIEGPLQPGGGGAGGGGAGGNSSGGTGGTGGGASGNSSGGAMRGGAGGGGGVPMSGVAGTTTTGGVPAAAGTGTAGTGAPPASGAPTDDGGCSVAPVGTPKGTLASLAAGLLLGLAWLGRRRQRAG